MSFPKEALKAGYDNGTLALEFILNGTDGKAIAQSKWTGVGVDGPRYMHAAQDETRDEMRELLARLMANAIDGRTSKSVRIEFISVLKQLNPLDELVLQRLSSVGNFIGPSNFAQGQQIDPKRLRDLLSLPS